jgi:protein-ribulosamine 3-kinase
MDAATRQTLELASARALRREVPLEKVESVSGGCIHSSFLVVAGGTRLFVKLNAARFADAFAAEADGLAALRGEGLRAPEPLAHGVAGVQAFIALEQLQLGGPKNFAALGTALAELHRRSAQRALAAGVHYGWTRDNYIGATPQANGLDQDWAAFWRKRRLAPQLALAEKNGWGGALRADLDQMMGRLPALFRDHEPAPSLLHGDLWSGNAGFLGDGTPVVFDPAVYRGDREADVAMTELFSGFPSGFYDAYRDAWPLDDGYAMRKDLYNLYHVLNHLNLFGGGYLAQSVLLVRRLLAVAKR